MVRVPVQDAGRRQLAPPHFLSFAPGGYVVPNPTRPGHSVITDPPYMQPMKPLATPTLVAGARRVERVAG